MLSPLSGAPRRAAPLLCLPAAAATVLALALAVLHLGPLARLDLFVVAGVHERASQPLTDAVFAFTALGSTTLILLVTAAGTATLAAARRWRAAITLALAVALTEAAVAGVKLIVARPRPPASDALAQAPSWSFPSGHAAVAMALYASLTFFAARACEGRLRTAVIAAGTLIVLGVGASRVYLGVHYPSDVVAGWLTGGALALACGLLVARLPGTSSRVPQAGRAVPAQRIGV